MLQLLVLNGSVKFTAAINPNLFARMGSMNDRPRGVPE